MGTYRGYVYRNRTTQDLRVLRSIKQIQIKKLENDRSLFGARDRMRLRDQVSWINAELSSRENQQSLFE